MTYKNKTIMKQDFKKIVPYLPYELKGNYLLSDVVTGSKDELRGKLLTVDNVEFFLKYATPILRPLLDLTKEIEVNGEKFVPIERLSDNCQLGHKLFGLNNYLDLKVADYFKLLEWHFDIFGMISEGLAIDINTIEL